MKHQYIFVIFLFPVLSFAQISLGVMGGANIGKFGGVAPDDVSYTSRIGLNLGASIAYRFNNDISLALQPMYSQRGSNIEVGEDSRRDSLKIYEASLDFLIIPLILRVDALNGVTYFVSGLEFGIPLSAEISDENTSKDISSTLNSIDILASIGMGLRFSVGKPDLLIEFRYYQGLVNLNSDDSEENGDSIIGSIKNNGFQLMAGIEWEF